MCENRSTSLEAIQFLVNKYPKALEEFDYNNRLPLHAAYENPSCSFDIAQHLVER